MKKLGLILLGIGFTLSLYAQKIDANDLPLGLSKNFKMNFPEAFNIFWQKTTDGYVADFNMDDTKTKALYNAYGDLLQTQWLIPAEYLPKKIKLLVEEKYKGFKVTESIMYKKQIETENHYKLVLTKKKVTETLLFDMKGEPYTEVKPQ
jgi:hypothetical protein